MPPPLAIDKEQVRMLVLELGVRETARRLQLNEETVATWSAKGEWLKHIHNKPVLPLSLKPTSTTSIKPADILTDELSGLSKDTKIGLARTAKKIADHAQTLTGEEALSVAPKLKDSASFASAVHGWAGEAAVQKVQINIFSDPREKQANVTNLSESED